MRKRNVAVIRGGPSDEYDVSLRTGSSVLDALRETDYVVTDVIITKSGEWLVGGRVKTPEQALAATDVVFNALHGTYGEDGQVQRLLDRLGVRYTGSGAYASAIAMNKALTKNHLRDSGILMAPHMRLSRAGVSDISRTVSTVADLFGPMYVIKPIAGGSSIGTMIAKNSGELALALENAFAYYDEVLVEKLVEGKEATVGVIEGYRGEALYVLPTIEIVPAADRAFFDVAAKYDGSTEEISPGRFTREETDMLLQAARVVHDTIGLRHYSRSDFIIADGVPYFLEVNTLPGLTSESLILKGLAAVGCGYREFILHVLDRAVQ